VTFAASEKDITLRVMKEVADYYSLHRNLRLDFINCKPKKVVEHLVSVIKPATLKPLTESKQGMVLRAAKDENSVDIICRRFACNFLRVSRI
jgi:hypothetical protein